MFQLLAQLPPGPVPPVPVPTTLAPAAGTGSAVLPNGDPTMGLVFGTILFLAVGTLLIYMACRDDTKIDRSSFLMGGAVCTLMVTVLLTVAGVGPWIDGVLKATTNTGQIAQPDFMGTEWNSRIVWAFIILGGALFLNKTVGLRMPWQDKNGNSKITVRKPAGAGGRAGVSGTPMRNAPPTQATVLADQRRAG